MENKNYTSIHYFRVSLKNDSDLEYSNRPQDAFETAFLAIVKALRELFPTWITSIIFNTAYAFGILANIVLLVYLIYYKRYKTPVFCVILSLGVADLGVCIGCLIFNTLVTPFVSGPLWMCKVTAAIMHLAYLSSGYHVAVFAALRYIQLVYPLMSHSKVTTSLLLKICLTIWGIHSIQAIVTLYYQEAVDISTEEDNDIYVCWFSGNLNIFSTWMIIVWCFLPFLTTSSFHIAKQVIAMVSHSANVTSRAERVKQSRRQTDSRALAIVIVTYLITIAPYIVQAFRNNVLKITLNPIQVYLEVVFGQLAFSNSAMNPWIYLFAAESVRSDIKEMLSRNKVMKNKRQNFN